MPQMFHLGLGYNLEVDLGAAQAAYKWKNLYLSNDANVDNNVNAGNDVIATGEVKTAEGNVNFNDKSNIIYNSTDECIEFVFN